MRIAITRPESQLTDLAKRAARKDIEIVALPLLEVRSRAFDWPNDIDLERLGWVFFTSANGVHSFLTRIDAVGCKLPRHTKIAVVGGKTRDALQERGYDASFMPSHPYGRLLFNEFLDKRINRGVSYLYARAKEVDFDPRELFSLRKLDYQEVICYENIEQQVEQKVVSNISNSDLILFTAPSAVRAFHRQFGDPQARPIAIGRTTAAEMTKHHWHNFSILEDADINSVLEYV